MRKKQRHHDIAIRLPDSLKPIKDNLAALAEARGMSLQDTVIFILKGYLNRSRATKSPTRKA